MKRIFLAILVPSILSLILFLGSPCAQQLNPEKGDSKSSKQNTETKEQPSLKTDKPDSIESQLPKEPEPPKVPKDKSPSPATKPSEKK